MFLGSMNQRKKMKCHKRSCHCSSSSSNSSEDDAEKKIQDKNEVFETVITMNHHLQNARTDYQSANKPWTICKAPPKLRMIHENGFYPTLVSIGPLHHGEKNLLPMEAHKWRFLVRLLDNMTFPRPAVHPNDTESKEVLEEEVEPVYWRPLDQAGRSSSSINVNEMKMEYLVSTMKELEAYTRDCYLDTFNKSSTDFVMMMIIDSCFIVELLRLYAKWGKESFHEPIFDTRWTVPCLKRDLLMLENQLPFPVLEKIFEITSSGEERFTLKDLSLKFFNSLLLREKAFSGESCKVESAPHHLLGLFRSSFQVQPPSNCSNGTDQSCLRSWVRAPLRGIDIAIESIETCLRMRQTNEPDRSQTAAWINQRKLLIHCVTELKEAGISFKKQENRDLLDVEFKNGKLYIPPLFVDDFTGVMFLNFVAYEQCHPLTEPYFTTYLLFWDSLLNSSNDVEHLHLKGIIDHVLGSDEDVAQLFNKLCREIVHDLGDCYLCKAMGDVNQYFSVSRHRWRAKLTHDYFSNPWAVISLVAAIFLLFLTFIQTFFSVFSYILPAS